MYLYDDDKKKVKMFDKEVGNHLFIYKSIKYRDMKHSAIINYLAKISENVNKTPQSTYT